jgi:hypothetical protein
MNYSISEEVLTKVLNTLAQLPYHQVADVMTEIQGTIQQIPEEEPEEEAG